MGRVRAKRPVIRTGQAPLAGDKHGRALSPTQLKQVIDGFARVNDLPRCACPSTVNPLLSAPMLTPVEIEAAVQSVATYVGALRWQVSTGVSGVPRLTPAFRDLLAETLAPLQCAYVQLTLGVDTASVASEDVLPGLPFALVAQVGTVDLGLHLQRRLPASAERSKAEFTRMLGFLPVDRKVEIADRLSAGAPVEREMLGAVREAVARGYVIPGACGHEARWFASFAGGSIDRISVDAGPATGLGAGVVALHGIVS